MHNAKRFLAGIILLMLAVNMADAAREIAIPASKYGTENSKIDVSVNSGTGIQRPISEYGPVHSQLKGPWININWISLQSNDSAQYTSAPIAIGFNVANIMGKAVCGWNPSNFKLETITVPAGGALVVIDSVEVLNGMPSCDYILNMVPFTHQGVQYKWTLGDYSLRLSYIDNNKELANKQINFRIWPNGDLPGSFAFPELTN
jgi:hypothetical protein